MVTRTVGLCYCPYCFKGRISVNFFTSSLLPIWATLWCEICKNSIMDFLPTAGGKSLLYNLLKMDELSITCFLYHEKEWYEFLKNKGRKNIRMADMKDFLSSLDVEEIKNKIFLESV